MILPSLTAFLAVVLPSAFSFALVRWLAIYAGMLLVWALTSTRATMGARRTFGRSKLVRWVSAAVGLLVFVAIPAVLPRLLLPSAVLLAIVPVVYTIFRLYRQGNGLFFAIREGIKRSVVLAFSLTAQFLTLLARLVWIVARALMNFDWATLKKVPDLYRQATEKVQQAISPEQVRQFDILLPDGLPVQRDSDPRLKGLPDTILPTATGLLEKACRLRATDVVLTMPAQGSCDVSYVIDGTPQTAAVLGREEADFVCRAMLAIAGLGVTQEPVQHGTFAIMFDGSRSDVLISYARNQSGRRMALRLTSLEKALVESGLQGLGMDDKLITAVRSLLKRNAGLLLVTGRPDSGKATTMYAAILEAAASGRSVSTSERDFRLDLHGRNVLQSIAGVDGVVNLSRALDAAGSHGTNVLAVRDIVDRETAERCLRAALAGQLVVAVMPADDSVAALKRLLDLGVDRGLMRSGLLAILSQRLAKTLCEACRGAYNPTPELVSKLGLPKADGLQFYRAAGCPKCLGSGFLGRTGLFELLVMNDAAKALLSAGTWPPNERQVLRDAIPRSLKQSSLAKITNGMTSVEEVARVLK